MPKRKSKQLPDPPSNAAAKDSSKKARGLTKNSDASGDANEDNGTPSSALPSDVFAHLIHPIKVETFLEEYWEKQPIVIPNRKGHQEFFQSLFTRKILEELVAEKKVSFVKDCNVCRYKDGERESLNGKGMVKPNKLKELLDRDKATIQFHQPQRFQESIWSLLEKLESFFGCLVGSNVYMTPKLSQGLAPHYDDVEVFVLQLEGEKHWRLYKPPTLLPRDYSRDLDQSEIEEPTHDIVLQAGDLMYFPRGTVHQADTPSTCSHSTHLTISTYQRSSWGDFLSVALPSMIQTAILENVSFRHGLPLRFFSDHSRQASSSETGEKITSLVSQLSSHIGSHGQEAANEMLCDFIANRLPPFNNGDQDFGPKGPMPSSDHQVRLRLPDHTFIVRRQGEEDDEDDEEEEEEDDGKEDDNEKAFQLFVYHSFNNSHQEHMMCSESKEALGIQLPTECEPALRTLKESPQSWQNIRDINLEDGVRSQMMMSLWAEGLIEVRAGT
ncbi:ribosomal oxygenase 2-like [Lytechinus pictus]|uniref:ribosomal oxygenase 2-like n=1 Tax=Lytechinus pictus TaxID=7653 RepID=UPI0030B9BDB3